MKDFIIGVLGGMGTYATIHLFQQYAKIFSAEKEWDRPRIIIDNRCTMPSRVRAYLYHENENQLINEMADSMNRLVDCGCTRIILACNTSHLFLPAIYEKVPELEKKVVHIIYNCVSKIREDGITNVYLLGSEGTIDSRIYQNALDAEKISCTVPQAEEYGLLRDCIEAVKQNKYSEEVKKTFLNLIGRNSVCILGCTELPILYEMYMKSNHNSHIYDPLQIGMMKLKEEYDNV